MTVKARSKWSDSEKRFVRTHYGTMTARDIAANLGRSVNSVYSQAQVRAKNKTTRTHRTWTKDEVQYLRDHYGVMATRLVARQLKRSVRAVRIAASVHGIVTSNRDRIATRTVNAWGTMLGIHHGTISTWARDGRLRLDPEFDEVMLNTQVISEETMVHFLKQGHALRCTPNANTPRYLREIIDEVKAQYISSREVMAMGNGIDVLDLYDRRTRMYDVPSDVHFIGNGEGHDRWHRRDDVWAKVYAVGHLVPRGIIKDPYMKTVVLAWDSVYVATWQLVKFYRARPREGHPEPIIRGVYNRAEVVAWLRTRPELQRHAQALRQDPVCYRDLHRDLDRKVRQGLPI